ncbi:MAG: hypothetical protein IKX04_06085 [Clostridiales bacterium]|nr:hypothetical protein [Clostridiales bacterium]MBO4747661.1 hypothetical protein [Clostridiales bacterium]MBR4818481.1 hypothetical protein [Clostridiales bacterium]MBR5058119.1 hypothetical protein [Clostridiales bacterium]
MEMGKIFTEGNTETLPQIALSSREGSPKRVVLVFESEIIGDNKGDGASEEHGKELMLHTLQSLKDAKMVPDEIILLHDAVKLILPESEVYSCWKDILDREIMVKACNETLFYLGKIPEDPRIICEDMSDLLQSMLTADRVIRL